MADGHKTVLTPPPEKKQMAEATMGPKKKKNANTPNWVRCFGGKTAYNVCQVPLIFDSLEYHEQ